MTLVQSTILMLTVTCALMLVGFSARESRWGPALMMFGPSDKDSVHSAQSMQWKIKIC